MQTILDWRNKQVAINENLRSMFSFRSRDDLHLKGRIKKIMQSDEEVGKVAQAVPIIISKTLELFVESLLEKTLRITNSRNAKTLSPSHMKQCIMAESRFDFLRELVKNIPDISVAEETHDSSPRPPSNNSNDEPYDLSMPSTSCGLNNRTSSPTNGNLSLRNGIQVNSFTPSVHRSISVPASSRSERKRTFDSSNEIKNVSANFYKENTAIEYTTDITETTPTKMLRTYSSPTSQSSNSSSSNLMRRLQHQSKSIPCTSKETHQPAPTPAPIINIDVCNRPIVKIDYSNLALHDKEPFLCNATPQDNSIARTCISPVINIDLSNITPQSSLTVQNIVKDKSTRSSSLELDEDYDNI